jgi:hypothetical protein
MSRMVSPTRSSYSHQHSSPGHWDALDEAIYYYDIKIMADEMGGKYSTHRRDDNLTKLVGLRIGFRGGLF